MPYRPSIFLILLLASVVFTALAIGLVMGARGHSFYDAACCSGHDCKPVHVSEIGEDGGYFTYQGLRILKSETRQSPDEHFHACVTSGGFGNRVLRCLYRPTPGS